MKIDIGQVDRLNHLFESLMQKVFLSATVPESDNHLTIAQKKTLMIVNIHGPSTMSEISRKIGVSMPAVTAIVDKLVSAGLVLRMDDPTDRRIIRIATTTVGAQVLADFKGACERRMGEILGQLDRQQRKELVDAFACIHGILEQIDFSPPPARPVHHSPAKKTALALIGVLTAALALTGCPGKSETKAQLKPREGSETQTRTVPIVAVEQRREPRFVRVTGSLQPAEDSAVASRVGGIVVEALPERGDLVNKGDILARLDPKVARNALSENQALANEIAVRLNVKSPNDPFDAEKQPEVKSAKSTLDLAESNFERDRKLHENRTISQADFEKSQNELEGARQRYFLAAHLTSQLYQQYLTSLAKVVTQQQNLEDTTITAPFAGRVVERFVSQGEFVAPGKEVAKIAAVDPLRLVLTVPEKLVASVREGQKVEFAVSSFPDRTFTGTVKHISPTLDPQSRAQTVEAEVPNPNFELKPGFFATARLLMSTDEPSLFVPTGAVQRDGDVARIFVVREGLAREQVVAVDDELSGSIRVSSGLKAGDSVVANGTGMSDGVKVR